MKKIATIFLAGALLMACCAGCRRMQPEESSNPTNNSSIPTSNTTAPSTTNPGNNQTQSVELLLKICEEENNSMQKVVLEFDGKQDYLFEIEDIKYLEDAIEYKNNAREDCEENYEYSSDFEIIVEYLHEHNIAFDYMALFNVEHLGY